MTAKYLAWVAVAAMLAATGSCAAEDDPHHFPPIDESASDPDFNAFKERLEAIVAARDADALIAIVAPDIKISFGGDDGQAEFISGWQPEDPNSPIWTELSAILSLGLTKEEMGWTGPYVFSRWPDQFDAFEYLLVLDKETPLLADPCDPASVLVTLGDAIVRQADPDDGGPSACDWPLEYTSVDDEKGHKGYIATDRMRSPLDYRANFQKIDGEWRLAFLVAGD
ncbi:MAG: hypothetical protein GC199_06230 [Alphaproteobacteria bacterium]|nr:hypothetical protein [Alphaproteobacteria bacterium]